MQVIRISALGGDKADSLYKLSRLTHLHNVIQPSRIALCLTTMRLSASLATLTKKK